MAYDFTFDPTKFYAAHEVAATGLATVGTLRVWRSAQRGRRGPAFHRFGGRVLYQGGDLNAWVRSHLIDPAANGGPTRNPTQPRSNQ